jgi:carbon-monoxide dehydrogenase iron sulfur subunit
MEPMGKVLVINYEKCTGCRLCELVCAVMHDGISNPIRSRIRVMKWESEGLYIPMSCLQCQDAPCMNVCPFGAMSFNTIDRKVFKCDLCDGDPQCVRFCEVKAIEYVDADDVSILKKKSAAEKISIAGKEAAVLQASM